MQILKHEISSHIVFVFPFSPPVSGVQILDCAFLVGATALTFSLISMTGVDHLTLFHWFRRLFRFFCRWYWFTRFSWYLGCCGNDFVLLDLWCWWCWCFRLTWYFWCRWCLGSGRPGTSWCWW